MVHPLPSGSPESARALDLDEVLRAERLPRCLLAVGEAAAASREREDRSMRGVLRRLGGCFV